VSNHGIFCVGCVNLRILEYRAQRGFVPLIVYVSHIISILISFTTWSLTLREEHRLRVFENRVFRRIFGAKRDGVNTVLLL
jgi:hypothetical protein